MAALRRFFQYLYELIKPTPPPPTLEEGLRLFEQLVTDLETVDFYLANVPGHNPNPAFIDFMIKSEFALSSARDELKILIRTRKELSELDLINARIANAKEINRA